MEINCGVKHMAAGEMISAVRYNKHQMEAILSGELPALLEVGEMIFG